MRILVVAILASVVLFSCAMSPKPQTLEQVKANLVCVEVAKGTDWDNVIYLLGPVDVAPLPEAGSDLQNNTRIYTNKSVIFLVENMEIKVNDRTRFREFITKIELCREK